jgi:hypothetical protein
MARAILIICFSALQLTLHAQNHDAVLRSYETSTTVSKGKLVRNIVVRIQINNRAGEKYATIKIPYSNSDKLSKIDAFILDRRGAEVRKLKKSDISVKSNISGTSLFEDDYVKEFTLKHSSYPYTIVYSYQVQQDEFIYVDYWIPVLNRKVPTLNATLTVSFPIDYQISHTESLITDFHTDTIESLVRYTWKTEYDGRIQDEALAPPLRDYLPFVKVVPLEFTYEQGGSFRTWNDYGNWESGLLKEIQDLPEREKNKITSLVEGINGDKEKIRILYHYLQDETRYVNVSIETGGLQPYPASYVSENKYGDCKALSNYFISVLQEIGIPAYYTNVRAGESVQKIDTLFPSQQFNHVILFIPLKQDTIWLDCTSDGAFGYLGTFTQNREAFVIEENRSRFVRTPALSEEGVLESRRIAVPYDRYSEKTVEFQNNYRGKMYELLAVLDESYNRNEKSRIMRNYFLEDGFELNDYQIQKSHRDSSFIQLYYSARSNQIYKHYGSDILVKNIPFSAPDLEDPAKRTLPVQIDFPIYKIDTITYEIPTGYSLAKPLTGHFFTEGPGEYSIEFSNQGEHLQVVKRLQVHAGFFPISDYQKLYNFFKTVRFIENKIFITLTKT